MSKSENSTIIMVALVAVVGLIITMGGTGSGAISVYKVNPEIVEASYSGVPENECKWNPITRELEGQYGGPCLGIDYPTNTFNRGAPAEYREGDGFECRNFEECQQWINIGQLGTQFIPEEFLEQRQELNKRYYYQVDEDAGSPWVQTSQAG